MSELREWLLSKINGGNPVVIVLSALIGIICMVGQALETASIIWIVVCLGVLLTTGEVIFEAGTLSGALMGCGFLMCLLYGVEGTIKSLFSWGDK